MQLHGIALVLSLAAGAASIGDAPAAEPAGIGVTPAPATPEPVQKPAGDGKTELPANPLWAISLRNLSATQGRPIFSPSRRPPAPPTLLAAPPPAPTMVAAPREADHPPLALVGTIVSENLKIGIFREESTKETTRLKAGEGYRGWSLRSASAREVEFEGPDRKAVLVLPRPQAGATPAGVTPDPVTGPDTDLPSRYRKR